MNTKGGYSPLKWNLKKKFVFFPITFCFEIVITTQRDEKIRLSIKQLCEKFKLEYLKELWV